MTWSARLRHHFDRFRTNLALDWRFVRFTALSLPPAERWAYLPGKYAAILGNRRTVSFLGRPFRYDNRLMPALLQAYPIEVAALHRHVDLNSVERVMDVGANVGQFAFVLSRFFPHVDVFSFEPNPEAFSLLTTNAAQTPRWRCFPFGLAPTAHVRDFYVAEGKSAQGSVFAENATLGLLGSDRRQLQVKLEYLSDAALAAHGLPASYDLVKIDVEGFEYEVLASLDRVQWRYLYLEISVDRRGARSLSDLLDLVEHTTGRRPRVVYEQPVEPGMSHADVILAS